MALCRTGIWPEKYMDANRYVIRVTDLTTGKTVTVSGAGILLGYLTFKGKRSESSADPHAFRLIGSLPRALSREMREGIREEAELFPGEELGGKASERALRGARAYQLEAENFTGDLKLLSERCYAVLYSVLSVPSEKEDGSFGYSVTTGYIGISAKNMKQSLVSSVEIMADSVLLLPENRDLEEAGRELRGQGTRGIPTATPDDGWWEKWDGKKVDFKVLRGGVQAKIPCVLTAWGRGVQTATECDARADCLDGRVTFEIPDWDLSVAFTANCISSLVSETLADDNEVSGQASFAGMVIGDRVRLDYCGVLSNGRDRHIEFLFQETGSTVLAFRYDDIAELIFRAFRAVFTDMDRADDICDTARAVCSYPVGAAFAEEWVPCTLRVKRYAGLLTVLPESDLGLGEGMRPRLSVRTKDLGQLCDEAKNSGIATRISWVSLSCGRRRDRILACEVTAEGKGRVYFRILGAGIAFSLPAGKVAKLAGKS